MERPSAWAVPVEPLLRALGTGPPASPPPRRPPARPPRAQRAARAARAGAAAPGGGQLTHFMALLLWGAGALAFVSGTPELGWAIWAVVLLNGAFSFWQERRAGRALSALAPAAAARGAGLARRRAWRCSRPASWCRATWWSWRSATGSRPTPGSSRPTGSASTSRSSPASRSRWTGPRPGPSRSARRAADAGSVVPAGATRGGRARPGRWSTPPARATALGEVARLTAERGARALHPLGAGGPPGPDRHRAGGRDGAPGLRPRRLAGRARPPRGAPLRHRHRGGQRAGGAPAHRDAGPGARRAAHGAAAGAGAAAGRRSRRSRRSR